MSAPPYAHFVTRSEHNGTIRIWGIRCPKCQHSKSNFEHRDGASRGKRVTCSKCGWSGQVRP